MRPSYYNHIIENKTGSGDALYYNMRTGSLAHMKAEEHCQFQAYAAERKEIADPRFLEDLKHCGFLVEDDLDEKKDIKLRMLEARSDTSVLSLTIAPTMECDLRCVYCYESGRHSDGYMTEDVCDDICRLVEMEAPHLERLVVVWYGGEPLLAIRQIEELTDKIKSICSKYDIGYSASIVTNGHLLTEEVCDKLLGSDITEVQITLDGDADTHNSRRPLATGGDTYGTILANLEKIHGKIAIAIRINIDKENQDKVQDVIEGLKERNIYEDVFCYLGQVTPVNGVYEDRKCLSTEIYSKIGLDLWLKDPVSLEAFYPLPMGNYCGADHTQSYVIDAKGDMYKCWSDIGIMERRMGTVKEWVDPQKRSDISDAQSQQIISSYMLYDPTEDEKCGACRFMPICMGGCPHSRIEKNQSCEQYRYDLSEYLQAYAERVLNERRGAHEELSPAAEQEKDTGVM